MAALGWLLARSDQFPPRLGTLGIVAGLMLVAVYLGRLIILNPKNPVLLAAILAGFVLTPAFYVWLGVTLRRQAARFGVPPPGEGHRS